MFGSARVGRNIAKISEMYASISIPKYIRKKSSASNFAVKKCSLRKRGVIVGKKCSAGFWIFFAISILIIV